jgi:hypothetical protein
MEGAKFIGTRPTHGFAVDGNVPDLERLSDGGNPILKATMEGLGIDAIEDPFEGVVGGDAVGKFEETSQPIVSLFAERFDLLPIFGATQNRTKSDHEDVLQKMKFVPVDARVLELAKVVLNGKPGNHGNSSLKVT